MLQYVPGANERNLRDTFQFRNQPLRFGIHTAQRWIYGRSQCKITEESSNVHRAEILYVLKTTAIRGWSAFSETTWRALSIKTISSVHARRWSVLHSWSCLDFSEEHLALRATPSWTVSSIQKASERILPSLEPTVVKPFSLYLIPMAFNRLFAWPCSDITHACSMCKEKTVAVRKRPSFFQLETLAD